MFHKHLDQASKRYKQHPNVAAMYTSLPKDKAIQPKQPKRQDYPPKIRDFAYDHLDPETNTHAFIADFADAGFQGHHRRVNGRDSRAKAGVLDHEEKKHLQQNPSTDLEARLPDYFETEDDPPQGQDRPASETTTTPVVDSASPDLSGTTATPSSATSATAGDENVERRCIGVRDDPLMLAVCVS